MTNIFLPQEPQSAAAAAVDNFMGICSNNSSGRSKDNDDGHENNNPSSFYHLNKNPHRHNHNNHNNNNNNSNKRKKTMDDSSSVSSSSPLLQQLTSTTSTSTSDSVEIDLAREMNELSVQEREKVLEEVHGVDETPEETKDFVQTSLQALDVALSRKMKQKRSRAMERAFFLRPSWKTCPKFKVLFLRAEYFNAEKAADRMVQYFESKLALFGIELLAKDITLDDLSEQDIHVGFTSGCYMVELPFKDRSGRPILYADARNYDFVNYKNLFRCVWYIIMNMVQPPENTDNDESASAASKKGICHVIYNPGNMLQSAGLSTIIETSNHSKRLIQESLPFRFTSFHFCYNNPAVKLLLSAIQMALSKQMRIRLRTHYGTPIEIQYSLMSFGIVIGEGYNNSMMVEGNDDGDKNEGGGNDRMTMNGHGNNGKCETMECDNQKTTTKSAPSSSSSPPPPLLDTGTDYLKRRREIEHHQKGLAMQREVETGIIIHPAPNDALIGRGHAYREYIGSIRYQIMIESELARYLEIPDKFQKTIMTMDLVRKFKESGGRFLAPTDGGWKELGDETARQKTAISLRSKNGRKQKEQQQQQAAGAAAKYNTKSGTTVTTSTQQQQQQQQQQEYYNSNSSINIGYYANRVAANASATSAAGLKHCQPYIAHNNGNNNNNSHKRMRRDTCTIAGMMS